MASRFPVSTLGLAVWIASSVSAPITGCAEGEQVDPSSVAEGGVRRGSSGKGGASGASMQSLPSGGASGTADPGAGGTTNEGGNASGGNGNVADSSTPGAGGSAGQSGSAGSAGSGGTGNMPMDAAIVPPDAPLAKGVVVFYKALNTNPMDDRIGFYFQVVNNGTTGVPIGALKIRYYFTDELNGAGNTHVYESFATNYPVEGANRTVYFGAPTKSTVTRITLANSYLEYTVMTSDLLQPGFALTMQVDYAAPNGQPLDETNDYSANLSQTAYAQTKKIVVFQGTTIIAGDAAPY